MDVLRPGAIPALIALCGLVAPAAMADCSTLDGTYQFKSVARNPRDSTSLSVITLGRELDKLSRVDKPGSGVTSLAPTGRITAPKTTNLAATATLTYSEGGTKLRFMDASAAILLELTADRPTPWSCRGERLERSSEHVAGLGDSVRTERVEEMLEHDAAGDLVYRRVVTVIDPPSGKPRQTEAKFPPAR